MHEKMFKDELEFWNEYDVKIMFQMNVNTSKNVVASFKLI